jgi:hypothetical protein
MTNQATSPRAVAEVTTDSLESAIASAGQRGRGASADLTPILIRYWHEFPRNDVAQRRRWLDSIRARVRTGETTTRAFLPLALGDIDEGIVFAAVAEFVGAHPVSIERRQAAIDEATGWVRRSLALNRGAVFAALLGCGDVVINDALGGLRLILTHPEIEVVCRRAADRPMRATREFLAEWLQLLDACENPDSMARELVARALAGLSA